MLVNGVHAKIRKLTDPLVKLDALLLYPKLTGKPQAKKVSNLLAHISGLTKIMFVAGFKRGKGL